MYNIVSDDEIQEKIQEHIGYTTLLVQKFTRNHPNKIDDYYQEANICMFKAIQTFNEEKNIKFCTYYGTILKNRFITLNKSKEYCSLYETMRANVDVAGSGFVEPESRYNHIEMKDAEFETTEIKKILTNNEYDIAEMVANGHSLSDIGKKHGVCSERIRQKYNTIMQKVLKIPVV
jgi:RNA polymerase sigma factor (sigma-70 family)